MYYVVVSPCVRLVGRARLVCFELSLGYRSRNRSGAVRLMSEAGNSRSYKSDGQRS